MTISRLAPREGSGNFFLGNARCGLKYKDIKKSGDFRALEKREIIVTFVRM